MAENVEPLWGEILEAPAPIVTKAPTDLFRNFFNLSRQENLQKGPKEADLIRVSPNFKKTAEEKRLRDKESDITLVPPKKQKRLPFKEMLNFVLDDDLKRQVSCFVFLGISCFTIYYYNKGLIIVHT